MDLGDDIKFIEDERFRHLHGYRRGERAEPKYFDGRLVESRFESFRRAKDKLETQQKSQQVRKPRRKSATQSKTPANSDLESIRKILEPYGHKI